MQTKSFESIEGDCFNSKNTNKPYAKWRLTTFGTSLTGTKYSADGTIKTDIDLKEDYTDAFPMDVMRYRSKTSVLNAGNQKCAASGRFQGVKPSGKVDSEDVVFINHSLAMAFDDSRGKITTWLEYPKSVVEDYLADFRKNKDSAIYDERGNDNLPSYQYIASVFPLYNENGILMLGINTLNIGSRKYANSYTYLCLDVRNKKQLHLQDILETDSAKIGALLDSEARRRFAIPPGEQLNTIASDENMHEHITVAAIPLTGNIIITWPGIFFCYNPGEVASGYQGTHLFISYKQLYGLLKDDFKKRMGI